MAGSPPRTPSPTASSPAWLLRTNDIDFRSRPLSAEETSFLASEVVLRQGATYADLESAATVVLAGLEPEDEAGAIFLRLRKATRGSRGAKTPTRVVSIAPFASRGLQKLNGQLVATRPGREALALQDLLGHSDYGVDATSVILVGERLATSPGALSSAAEVAAKSGAKLAWVPRRAGDRGAVEAGCLPNLLPGGRPVADAAARVDTATTWGLDSLPETPGRDADEITRMSTRATSTAWSWVASTPTTLPTRRRSAPRSTGRRSWCPSSCARAR